MTGPRQRLWMIEAVELTKTYGKGSVRGNGQPFTAQPSRTAGELSTAPFGTRLWRELCD
jgi:hypothetical protein